jgi:uncharacterized protein (DUF427 family)
MTGKRSLHSEHPDYRVDLEPSADRVRVRALGEVVADTTRALIVRETRHAPVVYLPLEDVRRELIEPTAHTTFCPFKGEASYWTLRVGGRALENVLWGYASPFDEVAGLAGYVAFYPDRVEIDVERRGGA